MENPHRLDVYVDDQRVWHCLYVDTGRGIIRKHKRHPETRQAYLAHEDGCPNIVAKRWNPANCFATCGIAVEEIGVDPQSIRVQNPDVVGLHERIKG